jgi:hypothetical protein
MTQTTTYSAIFIFVSITLIVGCNQDDDPEDEECELPVMRSNRIEEDTLCLGSWSWTYSLKWNKTFQDEWVVTDTVYPGEVVQGFETINDASMINKKEIYLIKNGGCSVGCYKYWSSSYMYNSSGPSDTVVFCLFEAWELASYIGMSVYISEVVQVSNQAQIGTQLFYVDDEEGEGIRYRDRYVRVE